MSNNYINLPIEHTDCMAHITWPDQDAPTLTGTIVSSTGVPLTEYSRVVRNAMSRDEIPYVQTHILNTLSENFKPHAHAPKTHGIAPSHTPMELAFNQVIASDALRWKSSGNVSYFRNNVLPRIKHCVYPSDFTSEDLHIMISELEKKSLGNPNSYGRPENAEANVHNHLVAADTIFSHMRIIDPSLPNLQLCRPSIKKKRYNEEMQKHLPVSAILILRKLIWDYISISPHYARSLGIMLSAGLRPAEAAAIIGSDIISSEIMTCIAISAQETDGERDYDLKTPAAYRTIPLDSWTCNLLKKTNAIIGKESSNDSLKVSKLKLSKIAKEMLEKAGLSNDFFIVAEEDMKRNPVPDINGNPMTNVTAYVLRRNVASIWGNYVGLSKDQVDYLLGHERHTTGAEHFDDKNPGAMLELSKVINHFDIEKALKKEPYITIPLIAEKTVTISPSNAPEYLNTTDQTMLIEGLVTVAEAGESINIKSTGTIISHTTYNKKISRRKFTEMIGTVKEND